MSTSQKGKRNREGGAPEDTTGELQQETKRAGEAKGPATDMTGTHLDRPSPLS